MGYEIITTGIALAGVTVGCVGAYYARRQYLIARMLARQSEERPHGIDLPQGAATGRATPLAYVILGEFIWYLCYPPATSPAHLFTAINNFLKCLDSCDLKDTRRTARPLETITLNSYAQTGITTPESRLRLAEMMDVVKSSLEHEVGKR